MYSELLIVGKNLKTVMPNIVISSVPADGLAPLGARPSAGPAMTRFA